MTPSAHQAFTLASSLTILLTIQQPCCSYHPHSVKKGTKNKVSPLLEDVQLETEGVGT